MAKTSYDYTYTNPAKGYTYIGQVVADTEIPAYNYVPGQSYAAPNGGTYTIGAAQTGSPTTAPSGAVYQTAYADQKGVTPSYHYDPKNATYYNIGSGYDKATGNYTQTGQGQPPVPAWSGIGLGNEYSYVNTGTATAPNYQTYGGGGTSNGVNHSPTPYVGYDYKFAYPDGSYYTGKVYDDGTYGYNVGQTFNKGVGSYTIYAKDVAPIPPNVKAGYNYTQQYHDVSGTDYQPSDILPNTPGYNRPAGYGGIGTEKDYIQKPGQGYYQFNPGGTAEASTAIPTIPPLT